MTTVFVASALETNYPWKLQKPSTVCESVRETAETFIMDSGIGDDASNEEVLELATEYDADYVIAKDYLHDPQRTTESVAEFIDHYEQSSCTATPMCPVQPDYVDHYGDMDNHSIKGTSITEWFDHYVLGGMAGEEVDTAQAIRWIEKFRAVEPDAYCHALGVGGGIEFVEKVAGTGLVDSIDCSTPELAATMGCVLDGRLRQQKIRVGSGDDTRAHNINLAGFNSWQLHNVWQREAKEEGLEAYR